MNNNSQFHIGDPVYIKELDMICNIERELGSGTQGRVYSLICPDNSNLVLKWYFANMATVEQHEILESLINTKSPSEKFLWPLGIVEHSNKSGFGYVMPEKGNRFKSFTLWLSRRIEPSFRILLTTCFEICEAFHALHSKGLCYQDLSLNNIYFDPLNGEIRIGDTDNIVVNGSNKGGVIGTPKFMAPEIITGKALPNTQTDLYSLAILLFYILFLNHPLEGKKETEIRSLDLPAMERLYGVDPVFIFDPENNSNYPDPVYHQNAVIFWKVYPESFKNLFVRAFTAGIRDPLNGRVRETEWQIALTEMRDSIFYCFECGSENFLQMGEHSEEDTNTDSIITDGVLRTAFPLYERKSQIKANYNIVCWNSKCMKINRNIMFLLIEERSIVVLNHDTKLYSHHIDPKNRYDFSNPVAEVTKHPKDQNLWGLKNLSDFAWETHKSNSNAVRVLPKQNLLLSVNTVINFGTSIGKLCY